MACLKDKVVSNSLASCYPRYAIKCGRSLLLNDHLSICLSHAGIVSKWINLS